MLCAAAAEADDNPSAPGHVRAFGVDIRCRPRTADAPPAVPPPMIVTPSVRANLESFALALCGVRPLRSLCAPLQLSDARAPTHA